MAHPLHGIIAAEAAKSHPLHGVIGRNLPDGSTEYRKGSRTLFLTRGFGEWWVGDDCKPCPNLLGQYATRGAAVERVEYLLTRSN